MTFIDLSKTFHTVNCRLLCLLHEKIGVPPKFCNVLRQLHDGVQASVLAAGLQSEPFDVKLGVKRSCVMASVLFNVFLFAMTKLLLT